MPRSTWYSTKSIIWYNTDVSGCCTHTHIISLCSTSPHPDLIRPGPEPSKLTLGFIVSHRQGPTNTLIPRRPNRWSVTANRGSTAASKQCGRINGSLPSLHEHRCCVHRSIHTTCGMTVTSTASLMNTIRGDKSKSSISKRLLPRNQCTVQDGTVSGLRIILFRGKLSAMTGSIQAEVWLVCRRTINSRCCSIMPTASVAFFLNKCGLRSVSEGRPARAEDLNHINTKRISIIS